MKGVEDWLNHPAHKRLGSGPARQRGEAKKPAPLPSANDRTARRGIATSTSRNGVRASCLIHDIGSARSRNVGPKRRDMACARSISTKLTNRPLRQLLKPRLLPRPQLHPPSPRPVPEQIAAPSRAFLSLYAERALDPTDEKPQATSRLRAA